MKNQGWNLVERRQTHGKFKLDSELARFCNSFLRVSRHFAHDFLHEPRKSMSAQGMWSTHSKCHFHPFSHTSTRIVSTITEMHQSFSLQPVLIAMRFILLGQVKEVIGGLRFEERSRNGTFLSNQTQFMILETSLMLI